jgi:hypothetical protein
MRGGVESRFRPAATSRRVGDVAGNCDRESLGVPFQKRSWGGGASSRLPPATVSGPISRACDVATRRRTHFVVNSFT